MLARAERSKGPWVDVPADLMTVLAFEPDPQAAVEWETANPHWHLERCALWSQKGTVRIHIGEIESTSSTWPPNFPYLGRFCSKHATPRRTTRTVEVAANTLDSITRRRGLNPDFVKIDTQGAEYDILKGSSQVLSDCAFAVLIETWTQQVHAGQGTTADVMIIMQEKGFSLFDVQVAAAWQRRNFEAHPLGSKPQIVGLDLLYFRDPIETADRFQDPAYAAKCAAIAEIYGHFNLALEIYDLALARAQHGIEHLAALRTRAIETFGAGQSIPFEAAKLHY